MALKKIVLHGYLRDLWDGPCEFEAKSPAELIRAFCLQTKALDPHPGQDRHCIRVVGFESLESLLSPTDQREIHIIPDFCGGKQGGFLQILVGVALIGLSFALPEIGLIGAVTLNGLMFNIGASLLLGGLLQLISPAPKQDSADPEASRYLGTPKNTVAIGTPIPILYGRRKCFGQYLSFDISALDTGKQGYIGPTRGLIWRVLVTRTKYLVDHPLDADIFNGVAIDRIEFRGHSGGDNLATYYSADAYFADSYYIGNEGANGPQHAFVGSSAAWGSRTSNPSFPLPHWVAYQFETPTVIHECAITCNTAIPPLAGIEWLVYADYYPYDFKIQYSNGPLTPHIENGAGSAGWTTVKEVTGQVWTSGPTTRVFNW